MALTAERQTYLKDVIAKVKCPKCGARAGTKCEGDGRLLKTHAGRIKAYAVKFGAFGQITTEGTDSGEPQQKSMAAGAGQDLDPSKDPQQI